MNREQIIRDTAYAIWEAEGRPEGRDREHWGIAEKQVAAGSSNAKSAKAPPAVSKATKSSGSIAPKAAKAPKKPK